MRLKALSATALSVVALLTACAASPAPGPWNVEAAPQVTVTPSGDRPGLAAVKASSTTAGGRLRSRSRSSKGTGMSTTRAAARVAAK